MSKHNDRVAQWTLDLTIYHDRTFGHLLQAKVLGRVGGWHEVGSWPWRGMGFPAELVPDVDARVLAVVHEHLMTRYGIQGRLPIEGSDS